MIYILKKRFYFTLCAALLLGAFGCGLTKTENPDKTANNANSNNAQTSKTDSLSIYIYGAYKGYDYTVNLFKQKYPGIAINVKYIPAIYNIFDMNYDDFKLMVSDLQAGGGPDIIFWEDGGILTLDLYDMMDKGLFRDLDEFMQRDKEFNPDDYVEELFNAGWYAGKRQYVPIGYNVLKFVTSREALDRAGVTWISEYPEFRELAAGAKDYISRTAANPYVSSVFPTFDDMFPWCGLSYCDISSRTVSYETADFRAAVDFCKDLYALWLGKMEYGAPMPTKGAAQMIMDGALLFEVNVLEKGFPMAYRALLAAGQTPLLCPMPSVSYTRPLARATHNVAINANSANSANAYNFVKMLLSEEFQAMGEDGTDNAVLSFTEFGVPVNKKALDKRLAGYAKLPEQQITYVDPTNGEKYYVTLAELRDEDVEAYRWFVTNVQFAPGDPRLDGLMLMWMQGYLTGEKTYEECIKILETNMWTYFERIN